MEQDVLKMLRARPHSTNEQVAFTLSCSERNVSRIVSKLVSLDLVSVSRIRYQVGGNWVNQRTFEFKEEA
jgi:predicted transcriptional regulator